MRENEEAEDMAANAFQVGPRRFSVYVSNYLVENMSNEEISAVMAHELARAKKRHVAKSIALFLFPLLVELNILIIWAVEVQTSMILTVIPLAVVFASMLLTPRIVQDSKDSLSWTQTLS